MPFDSKTAAEGGKASKRGKGKTSIAMRDTFTSILSANLENVQLWIKEVALTDPAKAIDLLLKMSSFVLSKPKAIELDVNTKTCSCIDLSLLTDEELEEQLHQANRVIHDNYCSETRTFKPTK